MSFIDNLRNVLRGLNIDSDKGSSSESEVVPKQLKIMDKIDTNQFPAGWTKRTYDIVTPEYDDDGNEVGYGMGENDRLSFYYDEDGELAGAETPKAQYPNIVPGGKPYNFEHFSIPIAYPAIFTEKVKYNILHLRGDEKLDGIISETIP